MSAHTSASAGLPCGDLKLGYPAGGGIAGLFDTLKVAIYNGVMAFRRAAIKS
jgi:hypothetical protein